MTDKKSSVSRRKLLKSIAAGSGAIVAGKSLPDSWSKPVVDSVILPAHAQTSPEESPEEACITNTFTVVAALIEDIGDPGNLNFSTTVNVCIDSSTTAVNIVGTNNNGGATGLEFDEATTLSVTRPDTTSDSESYSSWGFSCISGTGIDVPVGTAQMDISSLFQDGSNQFILGSHQVAVTTCNDGGRAAIRSFDIVTS